MGEGQLAGPRAEQSAQRWRVRPHCGRTPLLNTGAGPTHTSGLEPAASYAALPSCLVGMVSSLDPNQLPQSSVGWDSAGFLEKMKTCLVSISWQVRNIRKVLRDLDKPFGLYPNFLSPVSGNWMQREYRGAAAPPPADSCPASRPGWARHPAE